jgi:hypothetical protein
MQTRMIASFAMSALVFAGQVQAAQVRAAQVRAATLSNIHEIVVVPALILWRIWRRTDETA